MTTSRRQFLAQVAAGLVSLPLARAGKPPKDKAGPPRHQLIVGAMQTMSVSTKKREFALVAIYAGDASSPRRTTIPLAFHLHGFAAHPSRRQLAALFEKKGPGACLVDLAAGTVVSPITTAPERAFYGHGAFSADGASIFATETILATQQGAIVVRDATTLRETGRFPSHGAEPHDCRLVGDGKVLAVTNGGLGEGATGGDLPSVTWVEVSSGKLLERVVIPSPRINAGHLALSRGGDLAVVSAPRKGLPLTGPGGLTLREKGGKVVTVSEPADICAKMLGETLSVAIHEPSLTVAVTNPDGNLLTFWSLRGARLRKAVTLDHPRGVLVTPDGMAFAVTHGSAPPAMTFFRTSTLEAGARAFLPDANLSGSHIYNWAI